MIRNNVYSFIVLLCSSYYSLVKCFVKNDFFSISCMEDMLNQCPPHSSCNNGSCSCIHNFKQNPDYDEKVSRSFCVLQETTLEVNNSKTNTFGKVFRETPEPHHILGGILIPVCIVMVILGIIILSKKLQLLQRIRILYPARARRPAYEDVILVGYEH
uniref:(northern house mosquito) hypothetical protein n=1 Tax=Culex pipiens TaxID=7175 RepID=A0A8D8AV63_CULPI